MIHNIKMVLVHQSLHIVPHTMTVYIPYALLYMIHNINCALVIVYMGWLRLVDSLEW